MATLTYPAALDDDADYAVEEMPDLLDRLAALRERKPAAWVRSFGQPTVMFTSYELVNAAFRDEETFPSAAFYGRTVTDVLGRNLQCMYGDEHRRNRALASPAFRQRLMPGLVRPLLEPVAHELIDRFEGRGEADLVADFTRRYPFKIILRLLGLPQTSEEQVSTWALGMLDIQQNHDFALKCSEEFTAFVQPIMEHRRTEPADDLISTLATTEVDGDRLTDDEIMNFLKLLFPAGADTTYLGLGNTLYALLTNPDQLEIVLADPKAESRWAAEEGLRWNAPVALLPRHNPRDVVWHDVEIPGDTPLIFAIAAANRDPAVFPDPERFDVTRRPGGVLTFGFGTHFCLGAHLARAELEVSLQVLLERLPKLRLAETDGVHITSSFVQLLRGPNRLPVRFD
ncbi:MAG TPA: cytochrome P450 [Acidimicrobiia bacterium]|nr:cytochrome P450 [Acidimicrobiia bacterium]